MLAWMLLLTAQGAERMSVGRLSDIAARSPSAFDLFYAREAADVATRPRFYGALNIVGSVTPMESRFWVPDQHAQPGGPTHAAAVLPSGVFGSTLTLGGVGAPQDAWGWRMGIDSTQVGLTADEEAAQERHLDVPEGGWGFATTLAYVGWFHRDLGLSLTGGALYRFVPAVEMVDEQPHFTTVYDSDGELDGSVYTTEGFVHAGWRPLGQVAFTIGEDGLGQAIYRRPFAVPRTERLGPLLAVLPALDQVRAGAFVEGLVVDERWAIVDAELQARQEADGRPGADHASVQVEAWILKDDHPADADYRDRYAADIDPEVVVRGRVSSWVLTDGAVTGGAIEVEVDGIRTGHGGGDIGFALGMAYNDYRALTLLPLPDLPVVTFRFTGGL
mgnify:CR=1 FL=1